ncbi:hypothetical protein NA57DRAFT_61227 [Rhizodiscina lignyota]|uniref:RRM domain-containing protein n=1 Tax=Rhizodiscina lignyota TaxID=1504668 RepID=A0A9P4I937_9PEZI|nr:hypothetical protein NA57DRAFT_61227 [Rhizodiscina lignyota]
MAYRFVPNAADAFTTYASPDTGCLTVAVTFTDGDEEGAIIEPLAFNQFLGAAYYKVGHPPYASQLQGDAARELRKPGDWRDQVRYHHHVMSKTLVFEYVNKTIMPTPLFDNGILRYHHDPEVHHRYLCEKDGIYVTKLVFPNKDAAVNFMRSYKACLLPDQPEVMLPRFHGPDPSWFFVADPSPAQQDDDIANSRPSTAAGPSSTAAAVASSSRASPPGMVVANLDDAIPTPTMIAQLRRDFHENHAGIRIADMNDPLNVRPGSGSGSGSPARASFPQTPTRPSHFSSLPSTPTRTSFVQSSRGYGRNNRAANASNSIYLPAIVSGQDVRTTVMLRNIPNNATLEHVLGLLRTSSFGRFSFVYLRTDFRTGNNVGYAFIDFASPEDMMSFLRGWQGQPMPGFPGHKVLQMSYATLQGQESLVEHFRNSAIMDEHPAHRPHLFFTYLDGPEIAGQECQFPPPNNESRHQRSMQRAQTEGLYPRARPIGARPHNDMYDLGHPAGSSRPPTRAERMHRLRDLVARAQMDDDLLDRLLARFNF